MRATTRSGLCILLALLLAGCSGTTFLYNRLDFLIPWYVGKSVHLQREQKHLLRAELDVFLDWHRAEELPTYLPWLARVEAALDAEITAKQLDAFGEEITGAWSRIEARALDWMITLGESLSDAQMAEFMASLREEQAEWEEELLERDAEEYSEDNYDELEDRLEDYLGRLSAEQKQELHAAAVKLQRADRIWLSERARWLDRLEHILQREPGWQTVLREAIAEQEAFNSDEYHAIIEHNAGVIYTAIAAVLNQRSERQDRRLRGKLDDLQEDIAELIAQRKVGSDTT